MPGQELPSCSWRKNHSGCFVLSWTSISRTKSRMIRCGGVPRYFLIPSESPVSCKTGMVSLWLQRRPLNPEWHCEHARMRALVYLATATWLPSC